MGGRRCLGGGVGKGVAEGSAGGGGSVDDGCSGSSLGSGRSEVFSDRVGGGGGEGEEISGSGGIHCFAIFFSTKTTLRMTSRTIKPNAM